MNKELRKHINRMQIRAVIDLIAHLLIIYSILFALPLLFIPSFVSIIFIAIAAILIAYLIYSNHQIKIQIKKNTYKPVCLIATKNIVFEELVCSFANLTDKDSQISTSDDVRFYRLNKILKFRVLLYKTTNFDKTTFDNVKNRINKKANKKLKISQWVNRAEAVKMMRLNIIYSDVLNDALIQLVSQNASLNLSRVEGVINIAIVKNQVFVPPIYGQCNFIEIGRYKKILKFINKIILSKEAE